MNIEYAPLIPTSHHFFPSLYSPWIMYFEKKKQISALWVATECMYILMFITSFKKERNLTFEKEEQA